MNQKQFRIVRTPKQPSPPQLAAPVSCPTCGAWVANEILHTEFHSGLVSVTRWMRRVAELLGQVVREDLPAYDALVPADGDTDEPEPENSTPTPEDSHA